MPPPTPRPPARPAASSHLSHLRRLHAGTSVVPWAHGRRPRRLHAREPTTPSASVRAHTAAQMAQMALAGPGGRARATWTQRCHPESALSRRPRRPRPRTPRPSARCPRRPRATCVHATSADWWSTWVTESRRLRPKAAARSLPPSSRPTRWSVQRSPPTSPAARARACGRPRRCAFRTRIRQDASPERRHSSEPFDRLTIDHSTPRQRRSSRRWRTKIISPSWPSCSPPTASPSPPRSATSPGASSPLPAPHRLPAPAPPRAPRPAVVREGGCPRLGPGRLFVFLRTKPRAALSRSGRQGRRRIVVRAADGALGAGRGSAPRPRRRAGSRAG